jgi:hypothetical protein
MHLDGDLFRLGHLNQIIFSLLALQSRSSNWAEAGGAFHIVRVVAGIAGLVLLVAGAIF